MVKLDQKKIVRAEQQQVEQSRAGHGRPNMVRAEQNCRADKDRELQSRQNMARAEQDNIAEQRRQ